MDIAAIEYLENKCFTHNDFTNKFKSFDEFDKFLDQIQKIKTNDIYYFDLYYSISDIKNYYEDKFNIKNTSNHYLILYQIKFNVIEKGSILTPKILDNLVEIPNNNNNNIKCYYNDNKGNTKFIRQYQRPLRKQIKKINGMYILTMN
jgi:hypothetical protein